MLRSPAAKILAALLLGMTMGIVASITQNDAAIRLIRSVEVLGTLWINAIRMMVIPLVVGAIIVGVAATPSLKTVGSIGGRAFIMFFVVLFTAAVLSVLIAPPVLSILHIDADAANTLRASAASGSLAAMEGAQKIQDARQWLVDLVPTNPVRAAADGAMLPLIVFALAFGLAVTRVAEPGRATVVSFARGVTDVSLTIVRWILVAAPVGVFALSAAVALKLGVAAAGAVMVYIALVCGMCIVCMALFYLVVWILRREQMRGFARLWAAPQTVAFSSRSSLVALPAMIETAEVLRHGLPIRSFFLPLAVATFRTGAAINIPIGVLFLAHLYGVEVGTAQLVTIVVTAVITSFSVPGIPGGSIIVLVPVLLAAHLPVEGIGILLAVDTLPDMFRTATNVTGDMAVAALLDAPDDAARDASAGVA